MSARDRDAQMSEEEEEEEVEMDLSNPVAVQRYHMAADVARRAIERLSEECTVGKKVVDLCRATDEFIVAETAKLLTEEEKKEKKVEHGVAFPTCLSANNCAGHMSPLSADKTVLAANDVLKIDLGVQIDGFIVLTARTIIVVPTTAIPTPVANAIAAAHFALNAVVGMLRPGKTNAEVSEVIRRVAAAYHVTPMEGVLSHQMKRFVIDAAKVVMNHPTQDQRVESCEIEPNEVYGIDIVMSTGEGRMRELDTRTTIFKRVVDQQYMLKLKASKYVLRVVNEHFPTFPFTLRAMDEKQGRLGITELLQHGMVDPYPVLYERPGAVVVQAKATVLVFPDHNEVLVESPLPAGVSGTCTVEDALVRAALDAAGTRPTDVAAAQTQAPTQAPSQAPSAAVPMQM